MAVYTVDVDKVTSGEIDGIGIFDKLMSVTKKHILEEYDAGRIKGADYSNVYLGSLTEVLQVSVNFVLEAGLKEAQIAKTNYDTEFIQPATKRTLDEQALLLARQTLGFEENKNQKLFEAQLNAWALMFSSGLLTTKPTIITGDEVSVLYNRLKG